MSGHDPGTVLSGARTIAVAEPAAAAGARAVWLQLGITSTAASATAQLSGMAYLEDECTSVGARRRGVGPPAA